jgi:hypothetical protein
MGQQATLPAIDIRPFFAAAPFGSGHRMQAAHNPVAGLRRIYNIVDLEGSSHIDRLSVLIMQG